MSIKSQLLAGATMLAALSSIACGSADHDAAGSESVSMAKVDAAAASAPMAPQSAGEAVRAQNAAPSAQLASLAVRRSIVRRAELSVRVENVEKAERAIDQYVAGIGGYVDSAQSADLSSAKPTIDITLRVPVERFDAALDRFESLGVRLSKTISSEDVTSQIVDLDARLKTLAAQEETYRGLLRRASGLQSVITLQDKLTEVRGEIESMTGQRKALSGLAALSTVRVHLEQSAAPIQAPSDPNWLAQVWGESTTQLGAFARALAVALIWLAVFSPIWLPISLLLRRSWRTWSKEQSRVV